MTYTDEQKAEAVRLYVEYGADYAAETIGCSRVTIWRWLGQFATVATQKREAVREQAAYRWDAKREALRETMMDAALAGAAMARELADDPAQAKAFQAFSIGVGTFLDKVRLELGESTSRVESLDASRVDIELARTVEEWRIQTAHADGE